MRNKNANLNTVPKELSCLQKYFSGNIEKINGSFVLYLDPTIGTGQIRYNFMQTGLQAFYFDVKLLEDAEIPMDLITAETMQFMFCLEGGFYHQFEKEDILTPIEQLQTSVAHTNNGMRNSIFVKKDIHLVFNVILVNKKECFERFHEQTNHFDQKLRNLLDGISEKQRYFHVGKFNLKIAEQLKLLMTIEHNNKFAELLSQTGRYYLILAKHIEQFCLEINGEENTSGLLKNELKKVIEVTDYIKEQPEVQHSIRTLCLHSGLSPAKLQEGFKFMFDRTVSDFVRNVRLEKAEFLIKTTELTISEIVYTVGLTSRSYFCKIFKKKYNKSPKEFKNTLVSKEIEVLEEV